MVQGPVISLARGMSYVCPVCNFHHNSGLTARFPGGCIEALRLHVHFYGGLLAKRRVQIKHMTT